MKGFFKCANEDDERRSDSVKPSSLGMPPFTPNKYSRRHKRLSLGIPPCIPFPINDHQFVLLHAIFLSLHVLCDLLGASCNYYFFSLVLFAGHKKLDPSMPCLGEKYAPLFPRMLIVFTSIFLSVLSLLLSTIMF